MDLTVPVGPDVMDEMDAGRGLADAGGGDPCCGRECDSCRLCSGEGGARSSVGARDGSGEAAAEWKYVDAEWADA